MKRTFIFLSYILAVFVNCKIILNTDASYDYPNPESSEETDSQKNNTGVQNCTKMKFYCESCSNLVMCIDTEYGFTKQYVTCPKDTTCLRDKCTLDKNPLCDGTANIPFKCHLPGVFPDPFDCKKFHFCVPKSTKMVNGTLKLMHFDHSCQKDEGVEYRYDPESRYCKFEIGNGCQGWPVPLCRHEAQTGALEENKSIFYVCDLVDGHLYPYLYSCPHGEEYNSRSTKCENIRTNDETERSRHNWHPHYDETHIDRDDHTTDPSLLNWPRRYDNGY